MKLQVEKTVYDLHLFAVLVLLSGLLSCSNEKLNIPEENGSNVLTLNYQVDGGVEGQTYALTSEPHECQVNEVYTLFFRASDHATEPNKYAGYSRTIVSSTASSGNARVSLPEGESVEDAWQLLFLANFDRNAFLDGEADVKSWLGNKVSGLTFDEAKKYLTACFGKTTGLATSFPMASSMTKNASDYVTHITFRRRVARIDVSNSAGNFIFETAQVWNVRTRGYLFDEAGISVNGSSEGDFVSYNDQNVTALSGALQAKLYAFPNYVAIPTMQDHETTCLIIGGKYNGSSVTTYYRINVSAPNRGQLLKANSAYTINITNVTGEGETDPNDAYDRTQLKMDYLFNEWENTFLGTYEFDKDGNGLAVAQRNVIFSEKGGQVIELEVYTIPSPTNPISTEWSVGSVTGTNAANFTAERGTGVAKRYVRVSTLSDNAVAVNRQAAVSVVWGNISIPVNLTQLNPMSLMGGIKVNPNLLWFPKAGNTKEICVNLQGNFSGIAREDIAARILYTGTETGWLTLLPGTTADDPVAGIYYFKVTADQVVSGQRSANIKFVVTKGSVVATAQVGVDQTITDQDSPNFIRQLSVYIYEKQTDNTYKSYLFYDRFSSFKGLPNGHSGANYLHFSTIGYGSLKYNLRIQSSMAWKIVPSISAGTNLSFDKMSDAGDEFNSKSVWITANKDVALAWSGSFYVEYENGDRTDYVVYQEGILAVLPTDNQVYFYKTMMMNGKMWLDRNLGATVGQDGLNGYFSNQGTDNTGVTCDTKAKGVYLTREQADIACPSGFRLPKRTDGSGEWDWVYNNVKWSTAIGVDLYGTGTKCKYVHYVTLSVDPKAYWLVPICGSSGYPGLQSTSYRSMEVGGIYLNAITGGFSWETSDNSSQLPVRCVRN